MAVGRGRRAWQRWRCSPGWRTGRGWHARSGAGRISFAGSGWPQVTFCLVRRGRYPQVGDEAEHVGLPVAQAFQQVPPGPLLAARDAGHLGKAGQDAGAERVDEGRGDGLGDGGQALGAGGVGGVDQALQRLGDLDGPVRARARLGGIGQVAQQVLAAQLVDQAGDGVVVLVPVMHHHRPAHVRQDERGEGLQVPVSASISSAHRCTGIACAAIRYTHHACKARP